MQDNRKEWCRVSEHIHVETWDSLHGHLNPEHRGESHPVPSVYMYMYMYITKMHSIVQYTHFSQTGMPCMLYCRGLLLHQHNPKQLSPAVCNLGTPIHVHA